MWEVQESLVTKKEKDLLLDFKFPLTPDYGRAIHVPLGNNYTNSRSNQSLKNAFHIHRKSSSHGERKAKTGKQKKESSFVAPSPVPKDT